MGLRESQTAWGYADLSAKPKIIKKANPRVPLNCTQSHCAEWKNGTWPSIMGLSHQEWDWASPSPIILYLQSLLAQKGKGTAGGSKKKGKLQILDLEHAGSDDDDFDDGPGVMVAEAKHLESRG
ncbi:hypothetical protein GGX14DRAFT_396966 [Mycena pura]|uniref:Uncharacterized protein n=1 Tax=Mycena pura TaxID=153505 RepID=A0AAD6Y850_9AGAR|nr:hypothetical protein GGX14DRAFT_396966 [Mycena pura]